MEPIFPGKITRVEKTPEGSIIPRYIEVIRKWDKKSQKKKKIRDLEFETILGPKRL